MGCTSSAPNISDAQNDATDAAKTDMNNKSNGTAAAEQIIAKNHLNSAHQHSTGIPTSDTLTKNLHLPSYNSIFPNNDMEWSAKDTPETSFKNDNEESGVHNEDKLQTFLEVVDKVLVNQMLEDVKTEESQRIESETHETELGTTKEDTNSVEENDTSEIIVEDLEDTEIFENETEHESPTHSECSRATRWEALADIAAELPPSLAVDPLTGQIYSLAK